MSYAAALAAIIAHFDTNWAGTTEIAWPNVQFSSSGVTEYVRVDINDGVDTQITVGNAANDWRKFGVLIIQVFTELESGAKRSAELVDIVTNLYRGLQLSPSITFGEQDVVTVGQNDGFYQVNVEVEFHRDEQH